MKTGIIIREIISSDNIALAQIIRASLEEFNAVLPGTVYFDETTDRLSEVFKENNSCYFVVLIDGKVAGGAGIFPTKNLPSATCELVKLYLSPAARGKGIGKLLMEKCESAAIGLGYRQIYLESLHQLNIAVPLYEKMGCQHLKGPMGQSGHTGCDIWMSKKLVNSESL